MVVSLGLAVAASTGWEDRSVSTVGTLLTDVSMDPRTPTTWYALSEASFYASFDSGAHWRPISTLGSGAERSGTTAGIAFDPATPGVVFAAYKGRTYRSADGGVSWAADPSRLIWVDGAWTVQRGDPWTPAPDVRGFARDPSNAEAVYAATSQGVYASADGGRTWEARNAWLEDTDVADIRVDPTNTQSLVALTRSHVFRSTNGGRMWSKVPVDLPCCGAYHRIVADQADGIVVHRGEGSLLTITPTAATMTREHCSAWSRVGTAVVCSNRDELAIIAPGKPARTIPLDTARADVLRLREGTQGTLYAALDGGGVIRSKDVRSWESVFTRGYESDVADDPAGSGMIFAAANDGLYVRKSPAEDLDRRVRAEAHVVVFDPGTPGRVWAGFEGGSVQKSDDMGWTFTPAAVGLPKSDVRDIVVDPSGNGVIWAATWGNGVYRSPDGGASWAPTGQGTGRTLVRRLALDPANPATVWAAAWSSGLYHSADSGVSWDRVDLPCHVVYDVAVNGLQSENVAVGCEDGKIEVTADGGKTWGAGPKLVTADVLTLLYASAQGNALVAGSSNGEVGMLASASPAVSAFADTDDGPAIATAVAAPVAPKVVSSDRFRNIRVDMMAVDDDASTAAMFTPEGLFLTTDAGKTWRDLQQKGVALTGMDVDHGRIYTWVKGVGLRMWEKERWTNIDRPRVQLDGCSVAADIDGTGYVKADGSGLFLFEGGHEWYRNGSADWAARGLISCSTADHKMRVQLIPPERDEIWSKASLSMGTDIPAKTSRAIEKVAGVQPRAFLTLEDGRMLVWTKDQKFGLFDGATWRATGALPAGSLSLSWGTPRDHRLYVGTEHGIQVSDDYGSTFKDW